METKIINSIEPTLAFDSEIKSNLSKYLQNTIWQKVNGVDNRVNQLMELHSKYIGMVTNKLSANEIAIILYKYELNILKKTCN